jgi:hypothetical protein
MRSRVLRLTVALAVPLALLVSGCGGGGGGGSALAAVLSATSKTTEQDSARFRMTITLAGVPGTPGTIEIPAEGELDLEGNRTHLTMTFPEVPGQTGALGEMELISDGTTLYLRADALTEAAQAPTPWLKADLSTLSPELADLQSLSSGQNDPSQALELLRGAGELEEVGTETIDGTETTHYRGTLDMEKAAEVAPPEAREGVRAAVDQAKQAFGTAEVPIEVWVGSDDLIRRMRFDYPFPPQAGGSKDSRLILQMELFDFGEPVVIEAPPADQVTDINDLE